MIVAQLLPCEGEGLLVSQNLRSVLHGSGGQEIARLTLGREQLLHFLPQVEVISAGSREEPCALIWIEPESLLIESTDLLPPFRSHRHLPDSALGTTTRGPGSSHAALSAMRL